MLPKNFRLMKPADLKGSLESLRFPTIATPKIDGIRFGSIETEGKIILLSNSLKPIRNKLLGKLADQYLVPGLDGEIILLDAKNQPLPFHLTTSFVMSENKTLEDFPGAKAGFIIFDYWLHPSDTFFKRVTDAKEILKESIRSTVFNDLVHISIVPLDLIKTPEKALEAHEKNINLGWEGTVFRSVDGPYKFNRSTLKEQYSLKLKPFEDAESTLVGVEPFYQNENVSKVNERGLKEKSKTLEDRTEMPWLGSMIVDSPEFGLFKIGTGFDQSQRIKYWENKESLIGSLVKFKFMRGGSKDKPRHPVFLGFRDVEDL